jgi:hypothetical protein
MRRVFAFGLAILFVLVATQGALAQDAEKNVSDRLLEILKDRQIITEDEFGELKGLADQMKNEQAEMDRRLGDLDHSIADYLAKEGDAIGANVTYTKGHGFKFASTDGLFSLNLGGLFDFEYLGVDREKDEFPELDNGSTYGISKRDTNNLFLAEARWWFFGHAFDPALTYHFEFEASYGSDSYYFSDGFSELTQIVSRDGYDSDGAYVKLLDAYVNWNICDWTNLKFGRFKIPFGWQHLVHKSDLQFGNRALPYRPTSGFNNAAWNSTNLGTYSSMGSLGQIYDRDDGVMFHDVLGVPWFGDFLADFQFEYAAGLFDGNLASSGSWLMPAWRAAIHPFGAVPYTEGDFREVTDDFKMSFGTSWYYDRGPEHADRARTAWELDTAIKWYGFSLTAEWMWLKDDQRGVSARRTRAWYVQAGYMVLPAELEIFGRFGRIAWPWDAGGEVGNSIIDTSQEWSIGAAYYWDQHHLKALFEFGSTEVEWDEYGTQDMEDPQTWFLRIMFQLEW